MLTRYACYLIAQNGDQKKNQLRLLRVTLLFKPGRRSLLRNASTTLLDWNQEIGSALRKSNCPKTFMNEVSMTKDLDAFAQKEMLFSLEGIQLRI